jgi:hypothetical protein
MISDQVALDEIFERNYLLVEPYTLLMQAQVRSIFDRLIEVHDLPGEAIEFGAYAGGLSFFLGLCIRDLGLAKRVFMLDSFKGLPEADAELDRAFQAGTMAYDLQMVSELRSRFGLEDVVEILPGWFSDTVGRIPAGTRFCLGHLDADLYSSTKTALEFVAPRLAEGGVIVLDDCVFFGDRGVIQATKEVLGPGLHLYLGPKTQAFAFPKGDLKRKRSAPAWRTIEGQRYDVSDLLGRSKYLELVKWECDYYDEHAERYRDYLDLLLHGEESPESHMITSRIGLVRRR